MPKSAMDLRRGRTPPSVQSGEEAALQEGLDDIVTGTQKGPASTSSVPGSQTGREESAEVKPTESEGPRPMGEAPPASPFWSPKMIAEAELQQARPKDLEKASLRMSSPPSGGFWRPVDLGKAGQGTAEVRADENVVEPSYGLKPEGDQPGGVDGQLLDGVQPEALGGRSVEGLATASVAGPVQRLSWRAVRL